MHRHGTRSVNRELPTIDRQTADAAGVARQLSFRTLFRAFLALFPLSGCAVAPPGDKGIAIVDESGVLPDDQVSRLVDSLVHEADDPAVEALLAGIASLSRVPLYSGNAVELLVDGPATYAAMLDALSSASRYVYLETYIFADDPIGQRFAEALIDKRKSGVDVHVIYDAIGSIASDADFFDRMRDVGIELIEFNGLNPINGGNPLKVNHRNHRKLLVVDGDVAFTGGINLSSTYSSDSGSRHNRNPVRNGWRDTHIAVRGPAVAGFELGFLQRWAEHDGVSDRTVTSDWMQRNHGDNIIGILTADGDDEEESEIFAAYIDAMMTAKRTIWIAQAYFVPDVRFLTMIKDAAQRGVDVRVLVPGFTDSKAVLAASRSRYDDLLSAGIRVYEAQHALLHAKTAVIDGVWSTVGSSNLDYRSFLHNDEINVVVLGSEFGNKMQEQFLKDIGNAREITVREWRQRPLALKAAERLTWLIEYWL